MTEKMKILIGYDGSDCAEAAMDDLRRAGLPPVAKAMVMSVTEVWMPAPPPSSYEVVEQARSVHVPADLQDVYALGSPAFKEAGALAEHGATRLRTIFPGWEITTQVSVGSAKRSLIRQADEWKPDLIVVGSHGHSMLGRLVLGSVSQGVLTYAHSSVRVARRRVEDPDKPVRIVIGVDGSPSSQAAVTAVQSRAWPLGSEVRIIAVNDPLTPTLVGRLVPPVGRAVAESNQADREWMKKRLDNCAQQFGQSALKVSTEIHEGDPKRILVKVAEEWGADCIFVGSIGFGNPFERFVLGSVSASVAARAHCSVEVVRLPKTNRPIDPERPSEYSRN